MPFFKPLGKVPGKARLERILKSPNYKNDSFQNVVATPMSKEGVTMGKMLYDFLLKEKDKNIKPLEEVAFVQTDLLKLNDEKPTLVWFGHSSYLIKYKGKNILVDPVFSGYASPISTMVNAFPGTDRYHFADFPKIDLLIISHDHYDHLDYETVKEFKSKIEHAVMPLGVGEHFEHWGYPPQKLTELDWWEEYKFDDMITVTATPARHFSGRGLTRHKSLWASFVVQIGEYKIFIGGDSGYDEQFKKIGEKFGPFDLAMLECGQYNENWPFVHMFPEQTAQAAADLKAKILFPVHWGKFILSQHRWTESIERVTVKAKELNVQLTTPKIGEPLALGELIPNSSWWMK